jgi:hypothetical protein
VESITSAFHDWAESHVRLSKNASCQQSWFEK